MPNCHQDALKLVRDLYPQLEASPQWLCFSGRSLRFELGDDHPNGSTRRIDQAVARACALFECCFAEENELVVLMRSWGDCEKSLQSLIPGWAEKYMADAPQQDDKELQGLGPLCALKVCKARVDVAEIFRRIAHMDMGRSPSIVHRLYFAGVKSGLVFFMYDDRGCMVYAQMSRALARLRRSYGAWLIEDAAELY